MENERQAALKDLAVKSWNLELIISGAAIVLTTYLPDLVEDGFQYYHFNLATDWSSATFFLPVLAYAFFKTVAYLMIAMFVVHLAMRAFWVAMVGLQAAFPEGIRYDRLPHVPPAIRQFQEQKFGRLSDYILRLDRLCNQVLAFAFLVSLMGIAIGLLYNIFFGVSQLLRQACPPDTVRWIMNGVWLVLCGLGVTYFLAYATLSKRPRLDGRYGVWAGRFYHRVNSLVLPFFNKPIYYLTLSFLSNVSPRRYYVSLVMVMIFVMCSVFFVFLEKIGDLTGRRLLEFRNFYASGSPANELTADTYDNLRAHPRDVPLVSLPSDQIDGAFLPVFVAYPKMLDGALGQRCDPDPAPDSLPRALRNNLRDSLRLVCLEGFFQVYVNDSLYARPGWVYYQKPGARTRGLVSYLPTGGFRPGKNVLTVKVPSDANPDSLRVYGAAPFWFSPR